jgi:hypothetical protein
MPQRFPLTVPFLIAAISAAGASQLRPGKMNPEQATVASKTAKFETISSKNPLLRKALDAKNLAGGMKLVGKNGSFTGTVTSVYSPKGHFSVYIDFAEPWKNAISAQLQVADYAKFPVLSALRGKHLLVIGKFNAYQNTHPQIVVRSTAQIKIIR